MRRNPGKAIALALVAAACGPTPRSHNDTPDGGGGGGGSNDNGGGEDNPNPNSDGCSDDAKLIYVVDQDKHMLQFDPKTKAFTDLGVLNCPTTSSPFSMGIARDATAWVLYENGDLFRFETKNNLACTKSAWVRNTEGELNFGMGFSTDQVGGTTDTLFISGGSNSSNSTSKLAKLDLTSFEPAVIGQISDWPELTGTGNAELWGFFPGAVAYISKLDKSTGAALKTYQTPDLNDTTDDPAAWAFAFHGGFFWVFLQKRAENRTFIYQYDATTGAKIGGTTDSGGLKIVGAGVSTCAPVIIL